MLRGIQVVSAFLILLTNPTYSSSKPGFRSFGSSPLYSVKHNSANSPFDIIVISDLRRACYLFSEQVAIFDSVKGSKVGSIQCPDKAAFLSGRLMKDNKSVSLICDDGRLRVYSLETQKLMSSEILFDEGQYKKATYSTDGNIVVCYSYYSRKISFISVETHKKIREIKAPIEKIWICLYSSKYDCLVVAGSEEVQSSSGVIYVEPRLYVLNGSTGKIIRDIPVKYLINSLVMCANESRFASGTDHGNISVFHTDDGTTITDIHTTRRRNQVSSLAFAEENTLFVGSYEQMRASQGSHMIELWNCVDGKVKDTLRCGKNVFEVLHFDIVTGKLFVGSSEEVLAIEIK